MISHTYKELLLKCVMVISTGCRLCCENFNLLVEKIHCGTNLALSSDIFVSINVKGKHVND